MNLAAWIVSGLLAAALPDGRNHEEHQPAEKLQPKMGWVEDISLGTLRLIGITELLGAIGLNPPQADRGGRRPGRRRGHADRPGPPPAW